MTATKLGRWLMALAATCVIAGCGVDSENEPQPIDDTVQESGTTPSVDTRPGPTPSTGLSTTASPPQSTTSAVRSGS